MRIKQGIVRKAASMLAAGATLLACASMASASEPREYNVSQVGTAGLTSLTKTDADGQKTVTYATPDGKTVTGDSQICGDGPIQIGLDITIDLQNVKPGDRITVPFHTTDDSYIPLYTGTVESSGYLSANNQRVFTVKSAGTRHEGDHTVMSALTLTALNSVSKLTGKATMGITLNGTIYPGRINHFGRTSTALTIAGKTYTIPNPKQTQSANWNNAARAIGVSSSAGTEILQLSADSYGWQNSLLAGDQYASLVQRKLKTNRVVLTKITPGETGTEIKSIAPVDNIIPDDLVAGYDATTWSNTSIKSKEGSGTNITLANLSAADISNVDTAAAKLPAHQAAIVQSGNVWYVAVNFGAIADDPKLPASQSGYGDTATQTLYDNVRAKGLPYPSMAASFVVKFNDPSKKQTAKMERWANTEWKTDVQGNRETKVYHQGWDLATTPLSGSGSGSGASSAVTVSFDANGGTAVDSQKVKSCDTVAEPYTQRDNCTVDGWYLDGAKYDFSTPVTKDITLKANWIANHTVTFDANGGTSVAAQTVEDKAKAKEPTSTRSGWTLDDWYLDGAKYDFSAPVTKDITLKAGWRKTGTTAATNDGRGSKTITKTGDGLYTETLKATVKAGMHRPAIHETLSANINAAGLHDGKADGITVRVDGRTATGYKASYTAKTRTIDVAFTTTPAEGSAITVSYPLELSAAAKGTYTAKGTDAYDFTGDKDTGTTSAGKRGFATGSGTLEWDVVDTTGGAPITTPTRTGLPKAVVQAADSLPVAADGLPGTGSKHAITPILVAAGLAVAVCAALVVRRLRNARTA